ncbi:hypothetical protein I7I48_11098 [Histoplasma ohiense]|nr:hypothetical protein I7I48_11098 [Histoplasma ohiense (nom. inval.)]
MNLVEGYATGGQDSRITFLTTYLRPYSTRNHPQGRHFNINQEHDPRTNPCCPRLRLQRLLSSITLVSNAHHHRSNTICPTSHTSSSKGSRPLTRIPSEGSSISYTRFIIAMG